MTIIISAHLGDCILIAADKRAMFCDLETGGMQVHNDDEQKIGIWCRGAIAGSGETLLLDRIANHFMKIKTSDSQIKYVEFIYEEIQKRILEGVPQKIFLNNIIIFSMFDGSKTRLYSMPIRQFFQTFKENGVEYIEPQLSEIKEWEVNIACFNIPSDLSSLQIFQRQLKPMADFKTEEEFLAYYTENLKQIFAMHASIDPSVTTSFDLYLQSCCTGDSLAIHVQNLQLGMDMPHDLNYWNH